MALNAYAGAFTLNTATGNQSVTAPGFTPKIVLFFPTNLTADGVTAHYHQTLGFALASDNEGVMTASSEDAQASSDATTEQHTSHCIMLNVPGSTSDDVTAELVTLDANGFTINIDNAPAAAYRVGYLALGGSDITNLAASSFVCNTSLGNQSITAPGFQPDVVMFWTTSNATAPDDPQVDMRWSLGFATSSTERAWTSNWANSSKPTTETDRYQGTDQVIVLWDGSGTIDGEADFVSFDANGFTIDWTNAPGIAAYVFYVCLKGGQYHVGSFTTQTSAGNFSETGTGFTPSAAILASFLNAASGTAITGNKFSMGVATGSTERFALGGTDEDAAADSNADSFFDDGRVYLNYDYAQAKLGDIDFVSWGSDGFTLNQTDADPTGNEVIYLAIGAAAVGGAAEDFPHYPLLASILSQGHYTGGSIG
jgi:hypothetical protein